MDYSRIVLIAALLADSLGEMILLAAPESNNYPKGNNQISFQEYQLIEESSKTDIPGR